MKFHTYLKKHNNKGLIANLVMDTGYFVSIQLHFQHDKLDAVNIPTKWIFPSLDVLINSIIYQNIYLHFKMGFKSFTGFSTGKWTVTTKIVIWLHVLIVRKTTYGNYEFLSLTSDSVEIKRHHKLK